MLAALTACLGAAAGLACEAAPPEEARDGLPADSLTRSTIVTDSLPGDTPAGATDAESASVTLHFSRGESTAAVTRRVPASTVGLEAALRQLVRGPTPAERAEGIHSWFSDTTAQALRSVQVDEAGHAVVDFADLRELIPNASTSAGSGMLLRELNATVFAVPSIESVEYRIEGSCEDFWEWLQYGGCPVQERT
jgi:spore germination protein GerM